MPDDFGLNARLRLNLDTTSLRNTVAQLEQSLKGVSRINVGTSAKSTRQLDQVSGRVDQVARSTKRASREMKQLDDRTRQAATAMGEFGRLSGLALRRFAAFTIGAGVIFGTIRSIVGATKAAIDFERQMVKVAQVSNQSLSSLTGLTNQIGKFAVQFGASSAELVEVSRVLSQAGIAVSDLGPILNAIAKTSLAPTFRDMAQTTEGVIAAMRQFSIPANRVEDALGAINAVAGGFAVEADDIIRAIQRAGGVFAKSSEGINTANESLEEFLALFTSIRATTRESAQIVATGLRTITARLQRGRTIEFLRESLGVNLRNARGEFIGTFKAIERINQAIEQLGISARDRRFAELVEQLGGLRRVGQVIPLLTEAATAREALETARRGRGSLDEDVTEALKSLSVQIEQTRERFVRLIRDITQTETFKTLADSVLLLANSLLAVGEASKSVIPLLGILAATRGVVGIGRFIASFPRGANPLRTFGKIERLTGFQSARGFASGGIVPGTGNRDSVPALLTPGEVVLTKKQAQGLGIQTFQTGGNVFDRPSFLDIIAEEEKSRKRQERRNLRQFPISGNIAQRFIDSAEARAIRPGSNEAKALGDLIKQASRSPKAIEEFAEKVKAAGGSVESQRKQIEDFVRAQQRVTDRLRGQFREAQRLGSGGPGRFGRVGRFGRQFLGKIGSPNAALLAGLVGIPLVQNVVPESQGGLRAGLTGGLTGLALGSAFGGPIGAIIGALAGAGIGTVSHLRQQQRDTQLDMFARLITDQTQKDFTRRAQQFTSGQLSRRGFGQSIVESAAFGEFLAPQVARRAGRTSAVSVTFEEALQSLTSEIPDLKNLNRESQERLKNLRQLAIEEQAVIGRGQTELQEGRLRRVGGGRLSGVQRQPLTATERIEVIRKVEAAQERLNNLQEGSAKIIADLFEPQRKQLQLEKELAVAYSELNKEITATVTNINKFTAGVNARFALGQRGFANVQTGFNRLRNPGAFRELSRVNVFANPEGFSPAQLGAGFADLRRVFNPQSIDRLQQEFQTGRQAGQILEQALARTLSDQSGKPLGTVLENNLGGLDNNIRRIIDAALEKEFGDRGEDITREDLIRFFQQGNFGNLRNDITQSTLDALATATENLNSFRNTVRGLVEQVVDTNVRTRIDRSNLARSRVANRNLIANLRNPEQPFGLGGLLDERAAALGAFGGPTSVQGIQTRLADLRRQRTIAEANNDIEAQRDLAIAIRNNTEKLKILSDTTGLLQKTQQDLARIEQRKAQGRAAVEGFLDNPLQAARGALALRRIREGRGGLQDIGLARGFVNAFAIPAFGQKRGQQILNQFNQGQADLFARLLGLGPRGQANVRKFFQQPGQDQQSQQLIKELQQQLKLSVDAQQALIPSNEQLRQVNEELIKAVRDLIEQLQNQAPIPDEIGLNARFEPMQLNVNGLDMPNLNNLVAQEVRDKVNFALAKHINPDGSTVEQFGRLNILGGNRIA